MAELSRDEIEEVLGSIGNAIAAEIIATGIGKDELKVALALIWLVPDRRIEVFAKKD